MPQKKAVDSKTSLNLTWLKKILESKDIFMTDIVSQICTTLSPTLTATARTPNGGIFYRKFIKFRLLQSQNIPSKEGRPMRRLYPYIVTSHFNIHPCFKIETAKEASKRLLPENVECSTCKEAGDGKGAGKLQSYQRCKESVCTRRK